MVLVCAPARRMNGPAAMVAAAAAVNLRREIMLPPCLSCSRRAFDRSRDAPYVHWPYRFRWPCRWHGAAVDHRADAARGGMRLRGRIGAPAVLLQERE